MASLSEYGIDCCRDVMMGSPQGIVLGLYLWAAIVDGALTELSDAGLEILAFGEDMAVIIPARTKAEIKGKEKELLKYWAVGAAG